MNLKLFMSSLMITFAMLIWLVIQPGSSLSFIDIRVVIAFTAIIITYLSINWYNGKKAWALMIGVLLVILVTGSIANYLFSYGIVVYPKTTIVLMVGVAISCLGYIKFIEPRIMRNKYK